MKWTRKSLERSFPLIVFMLPLVACDCDDEPTGGVLPDSGSADSGIDGGAGAMTDSGEVPDAGTPVPQRAELWYSVDDLLVHISLNPDDGTVDDLESHQLLVDLPAGQNSLTMLADGSLLGARLSAADDQTYFYYIARVPEPGEDVDPATLGVMPDGLMLEALYSDCEGRLYAMDTGVDDSSSAGNRLIRFTGDVIGGDFSFAVVSDLSSAVVADIDDMGPGITGNEISDNPGLAIDTSNIYAFNYESGTGSQVGNGGTYGIHALGGPLFTDGMARLYVLSIDAELFRVDPVTFTLSNVLVTGPTPTEGVPGWSGLAGPLTECRSGFVLI